MDKVRLKKKWGGQEKVRKNWTGDRETLFLSIIDVYNPISDIENIQFIIYIWGEGTRLPSEARHAYSLPQELDIYERSEQTF